MHPEADGRARLLQIDVRGMKQAPITATSWNARTERAVSPSAVLHNNTYIPCAPEADEGAGAAWVAAPARAGRYSVVLEVTDDRGRLRDVVRTPSFYEPHAAATAC
jgi:hypothetical protein